MVAMVPEGFRHWAGRIQYVRTVAVIVFRIVSEVGARASASHSGLACVYVLCSLLSRVLDGGARAPSPITLFVGANPQGRNSLPRRLASRLRGRGSSLSLSLWPRACLCSLLSRVLDGGARAPSPITLFVGASPQGRNSLPRRLASRMPTRSSTPTTRTPPRAYDLSVVGGGARARPSAPCPATRIGCTKLLAGSVKKSICEARGQRSTPAFRYST